MENWEKQKRKEWETNADFWIKIVEEGLDPFRLKVTNRAVLSYFKKNPKKNCKVLELGCGEGYLAREIAKRGYKVSGLDFCSSLIGKAKEVEKKKPLKIKYFCRSAANLSIFPKNSFDFIVSHHFINELFLPGKTLKESYRVLKPGGENIVLFLHPCFDLQGRGSSWNVKEYFERKILHKKFSVSGIYSSWEINYLHLPLEGWIKMFKDSGFLISDIKEPHPDKKLFEEEFFDKNFKYPMFILIEAVKIKK